MTKTKPAAPAGQPPAPGSQDAERPLLAKGSTPPNEEKKKRRQTCVFQQRLMFPDLQIGAFLAVPLTSPTQAVFL